MDDPPRMLPSATTAALKTRWMADVKALGCEDKKLAERLFGNLVANYGEAHRAYHTLEHLADLFAKLDTHGKAVGDPPRLAFAAWYHDIVYVAGARDNEEQSARRAIEELKAMGASRTFAAKVAALIRATASHTAGGADADEDLFLDADFSILGAPPEGYAAYIAAVRKEYAEIDDVAWRNGRAAFLALALAQPRTFLTDIFQSAYGAQARANITGELQTLTASRAG